MPSMADHLPTPVGFPTSLQANPSQNLTDLSDSPSRADNLLTPDSFPNSGNPEPMIKSATWSPIAPLATSTSLNALQSEGQRKLLNTVDELRQCGLDGALSLPQLVVCGDQSSGKSSVLEAITEIPFPRKENLCTRFATEIILRRVPIPSISVKVIPDETRPLSEQLRIKGHKLTLAGFDRLPALVDEATKLMGLDKDVFGPRRAFAKDVLSIEICGPKRPQLTLVDLPGLIHSENKTQTSEDVELISGLVHQYISNPRTIILAVVSAKNDYANQIILKRAREVDSKGLRTLGIITKPDDLHPGSENEAAFIALAKNEDVFFSLGWHVLKNRNYNQREANFMQRNWSESVFFSQGTWSGLPRERVGIEALRARLSDLLFQHIKRELPSLRDELNGKYLDTIDALQKLGEKRSTEHEQRQYLMKLSIRFYDIAKAGVNGHYEDDYFGAVDTTSDLEALDARRLRAQIQHLSVKFGAQMRNRGHKFHIAGITDDEIDRQADKTEPPADTLSKKLKWAPKRLSLTEREALDWIQKVLVRTRGRELPGNFNPLLIGELFWEQSQKWQTLAEDHMDAISRLCENFISTLLQRICPLEVSHTLNGLLVEEALKARLEASKTELSKLLLDRKRQPITYNHYYTMTIQKSRSDRAERDNEEAMHASIETEHSHAKGSYFEPRDYVDRKKLTSVLRSLFEPDMDKHACGDALDSLQSFYKVALKTFIDNVAVQVIERHIVHRLENIFSPLTVSSWDEEQISSVAGEPTLVVRQREHLESRKLMLENGRAVFKSTLKRTTV